MEMNDHALLLLSVLLIAVMCAFLAHGTGVVGCGGAPQLSLRFEGFGVTSYAPAVRREELMLLHAGFTEKQLSRLDHAAAELWRELSAEGAWGDASALPSTSLPFPLAIHATDAQSLDSFTIAAPVPPPRSVLDGVVRRAREEGGRPATFFAASRVTRGEEEVLALAFCVATAAVPPEALRTLHSSDGMTVRTGARGTLVPVPLVLVRTEGGGIHRLWAETDVPWEAVLTGIDFPDNMHATILHEWMRSATQSLSSCLRETPAEYTCRRAVEDWWQLRVSHATRSHATIVDLMT